MKGGINDIMKQAQEMKVNMEKAKKELLETEVIGQSGGGMVKVIMNGNHEVNRVEINEKVMKDDKEIFEDLIIAAHADAKKKVKAKASEELLKITGGMSLPPGFKWPL